MKLSKINKDPAQFPWDYFLKEKFILSFIKVYFKSTEQKAIKNAFMERIIFEINFH